MTGTPPPSAEVADLPLPRPVLDLLTDEWGIESLYPPQIKAMGPALEGRNLLLTVPTASGKSLVAHLSIVHRLCVAEPGSRAIYIVPLKALASEKLEELRAIGDAAGLTVGLAIGDRDGEVIGIEDADVVVCTTEKLDSLMRNQPAIMERIGIVVADELHLLNDISRGPTLEVVLARLRHARPDAQRIGLSATIGNADEIAAWLDAVLVESDWRPVTLHLATLAGLDLETHCSIGAEASDGKPRPRTLDGSVRMRTRAVLQDTVDAGGQLLIFVNARASAEKEARELGAHRRKRLDADGDESGDECAALDALSDRISRGGDEMTRLSDRLAAVVRGGVAFHHAGLTAAQRRLIETAFRDGTLRCIVATPTLASGVNLPARRVLVRDIMRYEGRVGTMMPLSVMEVHQMLGRAGRPRYDPVGEAWILVKDEDARAQAKERYVDGTIESVTSKLANRTTREVVSDPALLTHVLAAIATGGLLDRDSIGRFFDETLLARQMDREEMQNRIDGIICWLVDHGMIERGDPSEAVRERIAARAERDGGPSDDGKGEKWDDSLPAWASAAANVDGIGFDGIPVEPLRRPDLSPRRGPAVFGFSTARELQKASEPMVPERENATYDATPFGVTIARLYLNPVSGYSIREGIRRGASILSGEDEVGQFTPHSILHLVVSTPDFLPLYPRRNETEHLDARREATVRERLVDDDDDLGRTKSICVLEDWIDEKGVRDIEDERGVQPGDLRQRLDLCDWLLYATRRMIENDGDLSESAPPGTVEELTSLVREIGIRVRHGCRPDLLPLVVLPRVGRVRAREMHRHGIETPNDLVAAPTETLQRLADQRGWSEELVSRFVKGAEARIQRTS